MERKKLVVVVKKLNETELTDPIDIKVKEDELRELFGQAVDSVLDNEEYGATEEERQQKLPEEVRAAYKELFLESEETNQPEVEDEKEELKKPEKTKKAKGEKEMKTEKGKPKKDKPAKSKKEEKGPSRKFLIYSLWINSKKKMTVEELQKSEEGKDLAPLTIKSWVGSWQKGKYLPAGAK